MATGGSDYSSLIEDETSGEEMDYVSKEYKGDDAAIMFHFFQNTDLKTIADRYRCQITRDPPQGLARKLIIRFGLKYGEAVERHLVKMMQEISKLDKRPYSFKQNQAIELLQFLNSPKRQGDPVCYIPDIAQGVVQMVGKSYEETMKAEHKLKVYLGEIKPTGKSRLGRQTSDPGDSSTASNEGNKLSNDFVKPSSFVSNYPDNRIKAVTNTDRFSRSYSSSTSSMKASSSSEDFFFGTTLNNGFVLKVYKGSILELSVDVIVNAANCNMMHGGGIARVISRAAGLDLEKESDERVKQHGNVKVGENIVTTAGNLKNYKAVIHAVGPVWYDYRNKTECLDDLADSVYNVLETCSKGKYGTVAMPAISAGIYAVPKELCADAYVDAAVRFSKHLKQGDSPRELHIVDIDTTILKYVESSVKKWQKDPQSLNPRTVVPKFLEANPHLAGRSSSKKDESVRGRTGQGHDDRSQRSLSGQGQGENHRDFSGNQRRTGGQASKDIKPNQNSGTSSEGRSDTGNISWDKKHGQNYTNFSSKQSHVGQTSKGIGVSPKKYGLKNSLEMTGEEVFKWGGRAQVYEFGRKVTVKIFKGDVTKAQNMAAVVCCMDKDFRTSGFVHSAIERAGGTDYKKNFQNMERKYRSFAKIGNVIKCKAGNLGVHHIIHVVMESMTQVTPVKTKLYSGCIHNVLKKANEWGYMKLVIPLFGTGAIQYSPDDLKSCCVAVLAGIDDYLEDSGGKVKVTDIHLVNTDERVCSTLTKVFSEAVNVQPVIDNRSTGEFRGSSDGRPRGIRNAGLGSSLDSPRGDKHDRYRSLEFDDKNDRHSGRGHIKMDQRERRTEREVDEKSQSHRRYDGNRGKDKFEDSQRYREDDYRYTGGRRTQAEGATALYDDIPDRFSGGNYDEDKDTRPPVPEKKEMKRGNLMIIEND